MSKGIWFGTLFVYEYECGYKRKYSPLDEFTNLTFETSVRLDPNIGSRW